MDQEKVTKVKLVTCNLDIEIHFLISRQQQGYIFRVFLYQNAKGVRYRACNVKAEKLMQESVKSLFLTTDDKGSVGNGLSDLSPLYVSSNRLPERMQSHIGLTFLHCL